MSNRYLKVYNTKSRSRERVLNSSLEFYEINKFIEAICCTHTDKVSQDLLNTICESLIVDRKVAPKQVHEMLMSSLEKSIRYKDSLYEDEIQIDKNIPIPSGKLN